MPTLRCFFAIYTDGARPHDTFIAPTGTNVFLGELPSIVMPGQHDELFGAWATLFQRYKPKRGFLLGLTRESKGSTGSFYSHARDVVLEATHGLEGWGLDVLRMTPFPLANAADALPEELLAEDLFAVGFTEMGEHGYRAETFGLAKLDQREISFEFRGRDLMEEAALMCGHLADWILEHTQRVQHAQAMAFGFDRLTFFAVEGGAAGGPAGPFRGWHPPLIQRLLPESLFPGVGVLEVMSVPQGEGEQTQDLTVALQRALEQRLILEELDLTGDSPNHAAMAHVAGYITSLKELSAWRDEPRASRDSGWHFEVTGYADSTRGVMSLGEIARRAPEIIRYLALPPGVRLSWDAQGKLAIDATRARQDDQGEDGED